MKISIILGTRPEIIKFSPILRECEKRDLDYFILHTGQHYSYSMDKVFFEQLELPRPKHNLDVGSGTHAEQTGRMLIGIEKILKKEDPDIVLVEGDTNTVLAGALAAAKLGIKIGHVEAGLRSHDRKMPEEINRILADHCSDLLFAPTSKSERNLLEEGIPKSKIFTTGNTIVDAIFQNLEISKRNHNDLNTRCASNSGYFLVTVHRQENVDNKKRFRSILKGLKMVYEEFGLPIIYPVHPRVQKMYKIMSSRLKGIKMVEPLDYLGFLQLEKNARLVMTDSGGVQEETCILKVPCVTLRDNTERPETLDVGSNILAGTDPHRIVSSVRIMLGRCNKWTNPFGDGKAGERIVQILTGSIKHTH